MIKPTIQKIATEAGVGTATVERVLNARGGVFVKTAQKVNLAAKQLDWPGRLPRYFRLLSLTLIKGHTPKQSTKFAWQKKNSKS